VQLCGNDVDTVLKAALLAQEHCDAIDINLGCPQKDAFCNHYGAYLMEEWDLIAEMVSTLRKHLSVPVFCKIRVYRTPERSVEYAKMLQAAGCQLLAVHGRTRKAVRRGEANWDTIKAVKDSLDIPVLSNGNIETFADVERCLAHTGVDGIMAAEGLRANPALFEPSLAKLPEMGSATKSQETTPTDNYDCQNPTHHIAFEEHRMKLALEYLDIAESLDTPIHQVEPHIRYLLPFHLAKPRQVGRLKRLGARVVVFTDIRDAIIEAQTVASIREQVEKLVERRREQGFDTDGSYRSM